MQDDSAEWLAYFKASGQLWPADQGQEVTERGDRLGLVTVASGNAKGGQDSGDLLARTRLFLSRMRLWLSPYQPPVSDEERQSIEEQVRVRTEWIRDNRPEQP